MSTLSIGSTRDEADQRLRSHRRLFAIALALQFAIGALFLLFPTFALGVAGLSPLMGPEWPSIWGATLVFVAALQLPGAVDPVNQRFVNVAAVVGRLLVALTFAAHGRDFWVLAALDLLLAALIYVGFRRLVIAELQTRP